MKRLIFLLLILLAGFSLAFVAVNPAQPPGVFAEAVSMAEYDIHEGVVTQPTVLVSALTEQSSFLTVAVHDNLPAPSNEFSTSLDTGQSHMTCADRDVDYYLLL